MDYILIALGIILALVLIYWGFAHLIKNKDFHTSLSSSIDIDSLIKALGGIDNYIEVTSTQSKLTVKLVDGHLVDVKAIQELGASGIVEGHQSISLIFGKQSPLIAEDLNKKKK